MNLWTMTYLVGGGAMAALQYQLIRAGLDKLPPYLRQQWMIYFDDEAKHILGTAFLARLRSCQWAGLCFVAGLVLSAEHNVWINLVTFAVCVAMTVHVVWILI